MPGAGTCTVPDTQPAWRSRRPGAPRARGVGYTYGRLKSKGLYERMREDCNVKELLDRRTYDLAGSVGCSTLPNAPQEPGAGSKDVFSCRSSPESGPRGRETERTENQGESSASRPMRIASTRVSIGPRQDYLCQGKRLSLTRHRQ